MNLTPRFPRRLGGVEVAGVSRFLQLQIKKNPTENKGGEKDPLTVVGDLIRFRFISVVLGVVEYLIGTGLISWSTYSFSTPEFSSYLI